MSETAAARFARDIASQEADRKDRGWDKQSDARAQRRYVDSATGLSAGVLTNTVAPAITGTAQDGQTLTTTNGTWAPSGATFARTWYANGVVIAGQTATTYVVVTGDVGKVITSKVVASKAGFADRSATSAPTAAVIAA